MLIPADRTGGLSASQIGIWTTSFFLQTDLSWKYLPTFKKEETKASTSESVTRAMMMLSDRQLACHTRGHFLPPICGFKLSSLRCLVKLFWFYCFQACENTRRWQP